MSQPVEMKPCDCQLLEAEAEIFAKAQALGWSSDEVDMLLFTYGPALNMDSTQRYSEIERSVGNGSKK